MANVLSRFIDRAKECNLFKGFVVGRDRVFVSHMHFANETLLFASREERYLTNFCSISQISELVYRLKVNMSRSFLAGISCSQDKLGRLAGLLGRSLESWPKKYLGLPLGGDPKTNSFWSLVIGKIGKRLDGWKRALIV